MNEELNELFEIKDEKKEKSNLPKPKQNVLVHSIIRVVVLIVTTVVTCVILFIAAFDNQIGLGILGALIISAWFTIMIFETIKLNKKNCKDLANFNIILIIFTILVILGMANEFV